MGKKGQVQADINNIIREKKRDALVSYLLTRSFNVSVSDSITFNVRFEDVKALYSFYLLDPEMNACTMTSRTVLAMSAVQLFIHRLLMGIETYPKLEGSEVVWIPFEHSSYTGREDIDGKKEKTDVSDFAREWEWRKNYRVWEANRKVFLYPENWIEPELRLDKTDFFKEFETELSQNALTDDHIEKTIASFVSKLKNVSDLKIIGTTMYNGERFVFGRTKVKPYKYYWTKRDSYMRWEGWHTLNVNPQNGYFVPVVRANRLHLIWPSFEEKSFSFKARCNLTSLFDKIIKKTDWIDANINYQDISINLMSYSLGSWSEEQVIRGSHDTVTFAIDTYLAHIVSDAPAVEVKKNIDKKEVSFQAKVFTGSYRDFFDKFDSLLIASSEHTQKILTNYSGYYFQLVSNTEESILCDFDIYLYSFMNDRKYNMLSNVSLNFEKLTANYSPYLANDYTSPITQLQKVSNQQFILSTTPNPINAIGDSYSIVNSADDMAVIAEDEQNTVLFELFPVGNKTENVKTRALNESMPIPQQYAVGLTSFDHKTVNNISSSLYKGGVKGLYSTHFDEIEFTDYSLPPFLNTTNIINSKSNYQTVSKGTDYRLNSVFGLYNWELYFYIPMLVSKKLVQDQQFEKAQRWMHYIFDPARGSVKGEKKYWRFKPFDAFDEFEKNPVPWKTDRHLTLYDILKLINDEKNGTTTTFDDAPLAHAYLVNTVRMWEDNPFEPHLLGQLLIKPYMRNVVITYINNLLTWGDMLFRQDTIESINEATQIYTVASDLLDRKPILFHQKDRDDKTYSELEAIGLDELSNASTSSIVSNWSKDALQADKRIIINN